MSSGSGSVAGNWGIHDTLLALNWVKDHIGAFGGDGDRITLIGEDSGAAIINYLLLIPKAKGKTQTYVLFTWIYVGNG